MNVVHVEEYTPATIDDVQAQSYGRQLLQVLPSVLWFCMLQSSYNGNRNKSTCHIESEKESLLRS